MDEMRRKIREDEPAKPSTRLTQELVAADVSPLKSKDNGGTVRADLRRLLQEVRGDLDWIVMKALEKDRTRRYESASGLATDIQRQLSNEPVVACPPSSFYRFRKLVRRNKLAVAAGGAVAAALIIEIGVSTWMFFKEKNTATRRRCRTSSIRFASASRSRKGDPGRCFGPIWVFLFAGLAVKG